MTLLELWSMFYALSSWYIFASFDPFDKLLKCPTFRSLVLSLSFCLFSIVTHCGGLLISSPPIGKRNLLEFHINSKEFDLGVVIEDKEFFLLRLFGHEKRDFSRN